MSKYEFKGSIANAESCFKKDPEKYISNYILILSTELVKFYLHDYDKKVMSNKVYTGNQPVLKGISENLPPFIYIEEKSSLLHFEVIMNIEELEKKTLLLGFTFHSKIGRKKKGDQRYERITLTLDAEKDLIQITDLVLKAGE